MEKKIDDKKIANNRLEHTTPLSFGEGAGVRPCGSQIIVGLGEALWDVLPEGNWVEHPQTSLITPVSSVSTVWR